LHRLLIKLVSLQVGLCRILLLGGQMSKWMLQNPKLKWSPIQEKTLKKLRTQKINYRGKVVEVDIVDTLLIPAHNRSLLKDSVGITTTIILIWSLSILLQHSISRMMKANHQRIWENLKINADTIYKKCYLAKDTPLFRRVQKSYQEINPIQETLSLHNLRLSLNKVALRQ
jgi:hypothetical protein